MTQEEQWLLDEKYHGEKTEGFFADCERLKNNEPLAFIIGSIPFLNTTIHLDSHPLIPRTETEFWVGNIISEITQKHVESLAVLDLCAGSGCVGVAVLSAVDVARVDFSEIDARHHATILKNITANHIDPARTHIHGGNLFEHITGTYDLILTNPPYIDPALDRTEVSVTSFEPSLALYGGIGGMEIIADIIAQAPAHLTPTGTLVIEHEPEQSHTIQSLGTLHGFTATTHKDQYNLERYTVLTRKAM